MWIGGLFVHLLELKDENPYLTDYPNLALLSCSHLFLVIISHREKMLTAFTLLDKKIELMLPNLSFTWHKLKTQIIPKQKFSKKITKWTFVII